MSEPTRLRYRPRGEWPRLAWVAHASADRSGDPIVVEHGLGVETRPAWFGEVVWDGRFEDGDFDRTEVVFGTGGRLRGDEVVFVTSASLLDRLHVIERDGRWYVSNSLPAVLVMSGDRLDPAYERYFADVDTLRRGIDGYRRRLPTRRGEVLLAYHRDVARTDGAWSLRDKPRTAPTFDDYATYRAFLDQAVAALAANARSEAREWPFRLVGTLSNGYDSTAVAAVVARQRPERVLSIPEQGRGAERLAVTAKRLGLELVRRDRYAYRELHMPEPPFLASGSYGYEIPFAAFEGELQRAVLFTGYYGDTVWSRREDRPATPTFDHASQSGLSLTEFRLGVGFVHAPIPFLGARGAAALEEVTAGDEMDPWRLGTDYDRPIARRISEEAGVPRDAFGYAKMRGSSTPRLGAGLTPASAADFRAWLREAAPEVRRSAPLGLPPHRIAPLIDAVKRPAFWAGGALTGLLDRLPARPRTRRWFAPAYKFGRRLRMYGREWYLFRYTAAWAVDRRMRRYADDPVDAYGAPAASAPAATLGGDDDMS